MDNRKLHVAELEVAGQFVDICEKNNLKYYMLGGTLLGAVRHNGFIPWDDDMDFGMPRNDYEKLISLLISKYKDDFIISHYSVAPTHDYQLKLESNRVKIIHNGTEKNPWIDILPMDGMPNNLFKRKLHSMRLLSLRALYKISHMSTNVADFNPYRTKLEKRIIKISKILSLEKIFEEKRQLDHLDKALKRYTFEESNYVVNFMGAYKLKEMFPKGVYEDIALYKFEDKEFFGPRNYDVVLKQLYGDYMIPPNDVDRNKHSTHLVE